MAASSAAPSPTARVGSGRGHDLFPRRPSKLLRPGSWRRRSATCAPVCRAADRPCGRRIPGGNVSRPGRSEADRPRRTADVVPVCWTRATARASRLFEQIPYAAVASSALGWRRADVGHPWPALDSWPSERGTAHARLPLPLRALPRPRAGRPHSPRRLRRREDRSEIATWDEDRIAATLIGELRGPLSLRGEPPGSSPLAPAIPVRGGHGRFLDRAREIEQLLPASTSAATSWARLRCQLHPERYGAAERMLRPEKHSLSRRRLPQPRVDGGGRRT